MVCSVTNALVINAMRITVCSSRINDFSHGECQNATQLKGKTCLHIKCFRILNLQKRPDLPADLRDIVLRIVQRRLFLNVQRAGQGIKIVYVHSVRISSDRTAIAQTALIGRKGDCIIIIVARQLRPLRFNQLSPAGCVFLTAEKFCEKCHDNTAQNRENRKPNRPSQPNNLAVSFFLK